MFIYKGNQIWRRKVRMDRKIIYNISFGKLNLGVDKSIILNVILEKYVGKYRGSFSLRIGYGVGYCGDGRTVRIP